MSDNFAIQADSIHKTYTEGLFARKKFQALKGVSFEVNKGEAFGLLGPNGAGKTTFIKILLGIIRKSSGHASLLGLPAGSRDARRLVGYLPEHLRVPRHMTGYTALECFGNLSNMPNHEIKQKRDQLLERVGLQGRGKDRVAKYSKGMVQRLGLAQALLNDPKLLILDEPTDGLDPRARAEVRTMIKELTEQGVTIFLNSHLLQEVESICERVAILDRGVLKYCDSVSKIGEFIGNNKPNSEGVSVKVRGDRGAVEASVEGFEIQNLDILPDSQFSFFVGASDQAEVDRFVDAIRDKGISLLSLEKREVSLEDAFLEIVK